MSECEDVYCEECGEPLGDVCAECGEPLEDEIEELGDAGLAEQHSVVGGYVEWGLVGGVNLEDVMLAYEGALVRVTVERRDE